MYIFHYIEVNTTSFWLQKLEMHMWRIWYYWFSHAMST